MQPEIAKYVQDIREACEALRAFTQAKSFDDYCADRLLRAGVEREFIIIGEALLQASRLDASVSQAITESRRIMGFRNVLVHGYATIDHATVWGVVQKDLPVLHQEVEAILATFGSP